MRDVPEICGFPSLHPLEPAQMHVTFSTKDKPSLLSCSEKSKAKFPYFYPERVVTFHLKHSSYTPSHVFFSVIPGKMTGDMEGQTSLLLVRRLDQHQHAAAHSEMLEEWP